MIGLLVPALSASEGLYVVIKVLALEKVPDPPVTLQLVLAVLLEEAVEIEY